MKKLLKKKGAMEFLAGDGTWTTNAAKALCIGDLFNAFACPIPGRENSLEVYHMVLEEGCSEWDFIRPVVMNLPVHTLYASGVGVALQHQ